MIRTQIIAQKVTELQEKIKTTNNGYLFAPTTEDVYLATVHPERFDVYYQPNSDFPFRIFNI